MSVTVVSAKSKLIKYEKTGQSNIKQSADFIHRRWSFLSTHLVNLHFHELEEVLQATRVAKIKHVYEFEEEIEGLKKRCAAWNEMAITENWEMTCRCLTLLHDQVRMPLFARITLLLPPIQVQWRSRLNMKMQFVNNKQCKSVIVCLPTLYVNWEK